MFFWIRWLYTNVVGYLFGKPITDVTKVRSTEWRCMPWDCDEYMHMNNGSYLTFTVNQKQKSHFKFQNHFIVQEMGRREFFINTIKKRPAKDRKIIVTAEKNLKILKNILNNDCCRLVVLLHHIGFVIDSVWLLLKPLKQFLFYFGFL